MPPETKTKARATPKRGAASASKSRGAAVARQHTNTGTMAAAASISADKPLTERQQLFVSAWARGETIPNAMHQAGYNDQPSYGYRMAKMPNVLRAYREEQARYAEASQMTRKKVIDMQLEAFELAKVMAEPSAMVAAAREIGKICGLYEPQRVEISGTVAVETRRLEAMTDAELANLIFQGQNPMDDAPDPSDPADPSSLTLED